VADIKYITSLMERIAPQKISDSLCQAYGAKDNGGLLLNPRPGRDIERVLCCLDITPNVAEEAADTGAGMIICHHPFIYNPISAIDAERPKGALISSLISVGIAVYASHLSLDGAKDGINYHFARECGISDSQILYSADADGETGYMRAGALKKSMSLKEFALSLKALFGGTVRVCGRMDGTVSKAAVLNGGGGGEEYIARAAAWGADVYVSGDFPLHAYHSAWAHNISLVEISHYNAEKFYIPHLVRTLNDFAREHGENLSFFESASEAQPYTEL